MDQRVNNILNQILNGNLVETKDDLQSVLYSKANMFIEGKKKSNLYGELDPVGKEDDDVDNDGDVDSSDKYLKKRRKAIGKAMKNEQRRPVGEPRPGSPYGQQDPYSGMDPRKRREIGKKRPSAAVNFARASELSGGMPSSMG